MEYHWNHFFLFFLEMKSDMNESDKCEENMESEKCLEMRMVLSPRERVANESDDEDKAIQDLSSQNQHCPP